MTVNLIPLSGCAGMSLSVLFGFCLFVLVTALAIYARHYLRTGARHPEIFCDDAAPTRALIERLPRLTSRYWPTPWLLNGHLQLFALILKKAIAPRLTYDRVDVLPMEDGGTTALHWLGWGLPADTPTLVVLHTITGSPHSMRDFMRDLRRLTGWRLVLCERRGHGDLALTSPRFNTMGDVEDLRHQLQMIESSVPDSPLYAAGVSAGTGLLVRYLGEAGVNTPLRGAFAYCPGYDISIAFQRCVPFYSRKMAQKLLQQFYHPNAQVFSHLASAERFRSVSDLHDFHVHIAEFAGYADHAEYLARCNPVTVMQDVAVPLLILNAEDDPVCAIENVRENQDAIRGIPGVILAVTARGSHCAHFSGWWAQPWAHALAAEYLLAVDEGRQGG